MAFSDGKHVVPCSGCSVPYDSLKAHGCSAGKADDMNAVHKKIQAFFDHISTENKIK